MGDLLELRAGYASATVDLDAGARLSSLKVDGLELLVGREGQPHPLGWGSYIMAPWAGRIRRGRFVFDGVEYQLPATYGDPPHAIHGTVGDVRWDVEWCTANEAVLVYELLEPWPFGGTVVQHLSLSVNGLSQSIIVQAGDVAMPVSLGWHPWFVRQLERGRPCQLQTDWSTARRWPRDEEYIVTADLAEPGPHPYDDCFSGMGPIRLVWPGAISLDVQHDCPTVVVYEPDHSILVEPQTAPPDAFNLMPDAVRIEADETMTVEVRWAWQLGSRGGTTI